MSTLQRSFTFTLFKHLVKNSTVFLVVSERKIHNGQSKIVIMYLYKFSPIIFFVELRRGKGVIKTKPFFSENYANRHINKNQYSNMNKSIKIYLPNTTIKI